MSEYTKKTTKDGRLMYRYGNRLVKKEDIPDNTLIKDLDFETVDLPQAENASVEESTHAPRVCIFCGAPSEAQKFVNLELVDLCTADYREKTTGEIVEKMREIKLNNGFELSKSE